MRLFDVALNLADPMFKGIYRKSGHANDFIYILKRAVACNVCNFLLTGTDLESSKQVQLIATQISSYSTAGIHPTHAKEYKRDFEGIRSLLTENKTVPFENQRIIVAIGECGLDYDRLHFAEREEQLLCFERHFDLAFEFQLPMFLHLRAADDDFLEMVAKNRSKFSRGVVHSFDGPLHTMKSLVDLDLFIGINGCSLKTAENINVVKEIPVDRLLIETDAPWCDLRPSHASYPYLQKDLAIGMERFGIPSFKSIKKEKFVLGEMVKSRNEPSNLYQILFIIANIKEMDVNLLAETIFNNTQIFLGLEKVSPIHVPNPYQGAV